MNLYLVLALALGAVTGAPAPATQRAATILEARSERAAVCGPASAGRASSTGKSACATPIWHGHSCPCDAPLTGAATPRAPARS